jgi:hypothetical protein
VLWASGNGAAEQYKPFVSLLRQLQGWVLLWLSCGAQTNSGVVSTCAQRAAACHWNWEGCRTHPGFTSDAAAAEAATADSRVRFDRV